jgi:hypothetical protein
MGCLGRLCVDQAPGLITKVHIQQGVWHFFIFTRRRWEHREHQELGDSRCCRRIHWRWWKEKRVAARIGSSGVYGKPAWYECTKQQPNMHFILLLTIACLTMLLAYTPIAYLCLGHTKVTFFLICFDTSGSRLRR